MRSRGHRLLGLLTGLLVFVSFGVADEEAADWPVPAPGARAVFRSNVVFADDIEDESVDRIALDLTWLEWSFVVSASGDAMTKTSGRAWGRMAGRQGGAPYRAPLGNRQLVEERYFPEPGSVQDVPLDRFGTYTGIPGIEVPGEAPRVGLTWRHTEPIPNAHVVFGRPVPAEVQSEVVAMDEKSITVRTAYPPRTTPDGVQVLGCTRLQTISRVDGFTEHIVCVTPFEYPEARNGVRTFRVRNALQRRPWLEVPPEGAEVDALLDALADGDAEARLEAATALPNHWPDGARAVPLLLEVVDEQGGPVQMAQVRQAARTALEVLGRRAAPVLDDVLSDADDLAHEYLGVALRRIFEIAAAPTALDAARGLWWHERTGILTTSLLAPAVRPLARALAPPSDRETAFALLREQATRVVQGGMDLRDPQDVELAAAAVVLAAQALPPVKTPSFAADDPWMRVARLRRLDATGETTPPLLAAFEEAVQDEHDVVRRVARHALAARVPPADLPALLGEDLDADDPALRLYAVRALVEAHVADEQAVATLVELLGMTPVSVEALVAVAALRGRAAPARDAVERLTRAPTKDVYDLGVRAWAEAALAAIDGRWDAEAAANGLPAAMNAELWSLVALEAEGVHAAPALEAVLDRLDTRLADRWNEPPRDLLVLLRGVGVLAGQSFASLPSMLRVIEAVGPKAAGAADRLERIATEAQDPRLRYLARRTLRLLHD